MSRAAQRCDNGLILVLGLLRALFLLKLFVLDFAVIQVELDKDAAMK
jgi:hypothetical protein